MAVERQAVGSPVGQADGLGLSPGCEVHLILELAAVASEGHVPPGLQLAVGPIPGQWASRWTSGRVSSSEVVDRAGAETGGLDGRVGVGAENDRAGLVPVGPVPGLGWGGRLLVAHWAGVKEKGFAGSEEEPRARAVPRYVDPGVGWPALGTRREHFAVGGEGGCLVVWRWTGPTGPCAPVPGTPTAPSQLPRRAAWQRADGPLPLGPDSLCTHVSPPHCWTEAVLAGGASPPQDCMRGLPDPGRPRMRRAGRLTCSCVDASCIGRSLAPRQNYGFSKARELDGGWILAHHSAARDPHRKTRGTLEATRQRTVLGGSLSHKYRVRTLALAGNDVANRVLISVISAAISRDQRSARLVPEMVASHRASAEGDRSVRQRRVEVGWSGLQVGSLSGGTGATGWRSRCALILVLDARTPKPPANTGAQRDASPHQQIGCG